MFRFEPVGTSISAFVYSIKMEPQRRGWLNSTEVMMPGFSPSEVLKKQVLDHLIKVGVPEH